MKVTFPMTIRDAGTSLLLTVPRQVVKAGFSSGDLVIVTLENIDKHTILKVKKVIKNEQKREKGINR